MARKINHYTLHIVSDLTGSLADHLISSVLTQFPDIDFTMHYHTFCDTPEKLQKTIDAFGRGRHLVFYALVDSANKQAIHNACRERGIPSFDVTGSLVQFISDHTHVQPVNELSRLHQGDAGYFRRIDAIEFTLQHDDGRNLETLHQAQIVIVGLSRVSKSPTAVYLGSLGYKTANVSISPQTGFPKQLNQAKKRTVALTIQPQALRAARETRARQFGLENTEYTDQRSINREIMEAEEEYHRRGYPVIDTTGETIEMIATRIIEAIGPRNRARTWA